MTIDELKKDLRLLAQAQDAFTEEGWVRVESIQKESKSNSTAYGTVYMKDDKKFYLNLTTAVKALQLLNQNYIP